MSQDPGGRGIEIHAVTVGVLFISLALLMFEMHQAVTLSLQVFHRTAFLVISLCMFGLGAGGSLATFLTRKGLTGRRDWLWAVSLGFAGGLLAASILGSRSSALEVLSLIGVLPYLFAGLLLSVIFQRWPEHAGRIYCFNLVGSGLGCVGIVSALDGLGDAGLVYLLIAELGLLGSLCLALPLSRRATLGTLALILATGTLFPLTEQLFVFRPASYKAYGRILRTPEMKSTLEWSKWGYLGRLDSVIPGPGIGNFGYFGAWVRDVHEGGAETRLLFASGDNWSTTVDFKGDEEYRARFLREMVPAAPYIFFDAPDVLNVGVGGGVDVFLALSHGARSVVGVEINPLMIEAVRERHRGFFDDSYDDPRVTILQLDGRTFVNDTDARFDVITLTAVDTGAGLGAGGYLLSENYLYTQEAFDNYLRILKPGGVLFVYRPSLDFVRVVTTATASLRKLGVEDPEDHLALFGGSTWIGAIVGKSPLSEERNADLGTRLARGDFGGTSYLVGGQSNDDRFRPLVDAIARDREEPFLRGLPVDVTPVFDDRPYFYQFHREFLTSDAGRLLLRIFFTVVTAAAVLILLPLLGVGRALGARTWVTTLGYFASIGLGFMLVELALIQKLVLFLGHPSYSLTVTLFAVLVFSGLGSLLVDRLPRITTTLVVCCIPGVILAAAFYALGLQTVLEWLRVQSLLGRAVVVAALLAPGSVLMGVPFPSMIRMLGNGRTPLISWSWGVNALAAVVASIVAVMISMNWGFTSTLLAGAFCYVLAVGCALARPGQAEA